MGELGKDGIQVRRIATYAEESGAGDLARCSWAAAVVAYPCTPGLFADLELFAALGEELGRRLGYLALAALGCERENCASYGKGAIVGSAAALEHAAAILHPRLGRPLRELLGRGKAIIPSTIKQGALGASLDVPLHGVDNEWDFALLHALEVCVPGAPRHDEIVVAIALAGCGGRKWFVSENERHA